MCKYLIMDNERAVTLQKEIDELTVESKNYKQDKTDSMNSITNLMEQILLVTRWEQNKTDLIKSITNLMEQISTLIKDMNTNQILWGGLRERVRHLEQQKANGPQEAITMRSQANSYLIE